MGLGIPGIDDSKITELYEGDYGIYLPVLQAYAQDLGASLEKLRKIVVSAETLPDYARIMHGVKGASASACAEEARKRALAMETLAKAGNLAGALTENGPFLQYMGDLAVGIRLWLSKNKDKFE